MYTIIITSVIHIIWSYLLVIHFKLEILGVGIATILTYFLNFIIISIYCRFDKEICSGFFFFTRDSFSNIGEYLKVAIPSTIMLCLEWWSLEILAFMAAYISIDATAAYVIILNVLVVIIMIPEGAQVSVTVLVG